MNFSQFPKNRGDMKITSKEHLHESPQPPASIIVTSKNPKNRPKKMEGTNPFGPSGICRSWFLEIRFREFRETRHLSFYIPLDKEDRSDRAKYENKKP